eukprot:scaffold43758_cov18-Tisochrysis_lutea.AAC.1
MVAWHEELRWSYRGVHECTYGCNKCEMITMLVPTATDGGMTLSVLAWVSLALEEFHKRHSDASPPSLVAVVWAVS